MAEELTQAQLDCYAANNIGSFLSEAAVNLRYFGWYTFKLTPHERNVLEIINMNVPDGGSAFRLCEKYASRWTGIPVATIYDLQIDGDFLTVIPEGNSSA